MNIFFLILAILLATSVIVTIIKIVGQQKHVSDNDLRSLSRISPRDKNYNRIIAHLGQCERCRNRMDDLQHELDHLVE